MIFRTLAAITVSLLILEIVIFNAWLYFVTKNMTLAEKYWQNNFDSQDTEGLSYAQITLLKFISLTRVVTIAFCCLYIFVLIVK